MLKLANDLALPIEAVTQKFAFLGRTGGGKTYAAMKLCELFLEARAQVVALDPVGNWFGLRLAADGKRKGFSIPVFGGEQGDVPLEPQSGRLIAKLIVEKNFSAILDVSSFRKEQRKQFATDFAEELFHRKKTAKSAMHVFFEEAQLFVPQQSFDKDKRMLGAFEDLIRLGRNYGIGASLLSQRPQSVNKEVLNQTEILLAFQMTGPHERKAVAGWIQEKGFSENLNEILPSLEVGQAHIWSPQWLRVSKTIHVLKKQTYDASSTPEVGQAVVEPKELSPVDVEQLTVAMADVVKRADENDPKKLKAEILTLKRDLEKAQKNIPAAVAEVTTKIERVEVPVITDKQLERAQLSATTLTGFIEQMETVLSGVRKVRDDFLAGVNQVKGFKPPVPVAKPGPAGGVYAKFIKTDRPARVVSNGNGDLNKFQQEILNGLAEWECLGVARPTRRQLAFMVEKSAKSSYFTNTVSSLKTSGYVDYPSGGLVALTDAGRENTAAEPPTSLTEFHDRIKTLLSAFETQMFDAAVAHYPNALTRSELAQAVDKSEISSYFTNTVSGLKTKGILNYPSSGYVKADELLFPDGLS